jgi:hypothetical protein
LSGRGSWGFGGLDISAEQSILASRARDFKAADRGPVRIRTIRPIRSAITAQSDTPKTIPCHIILPDYLPPLHNPVLQLTIQVLAVDLLNRPAEVEARTHKLKKVVPEPNSFFMDVKCPGCFQITYVNSAGTERVLPDEMWKDKC